MSNIRYVDVTEPEQMQMEITRLVSAGFTVANQSERSVTLVKRKQFSIPILIIGFLLCVIPLLIYLVVYAFQSDQIVEIRLVDKPVVTPYRASDHVSVDGESSVSVEGAPDGEQWWDGAKWQPTATSYPPHALRKPDGSEWWDGERWRPVPGRS